MAFLIDVRNSEEPDVVTPEDRAAIVADVVAALGRQPDGSPGLIGVEIRHQFGGYVGGSVYTDAALISALRKTAGLSKSS